MKNLSPIFPDFPDFLRTSYAGKRPNGKNGCPMIPIVFQWRIPMDRDWHVYSQSVIHTNGLLGMFGEMGIFPTIIHQFHGVGCLLIRPTLSSLEWNPAECFRSHGIIWSTASHPDLKWKIWKNVDHSEVSDLFAEKWIFPVVQITRGMFIAFAFVFVRSFPKDHAFYLICSSPTKRLKHFRVFLLSGRIINAFF